MAWVVAPAISESERLLERPQESVNVTHLERDVWAAAVELRLEAHHRRHCALTKLCGCDVASDLSRKLARLSAIASLNENLHDLQAAERGFFCEAGIEK